MGISIVELDKAIQSLQVSIHLLEESLKNQAANSDLHQALRDACIQRFEFCVELSWKTAIKALGLETKAPNPAIRDMLQNNLIDTPDIWFEFLIARNKTSHTYDESTANEVYAVVKTSVAHFLNLSNRIKNIK